MHDVVLKGGRVLDGAGNPAFRADVGVRGDRIVEVGHGIGDGERVVDVAGLYVCPGFVDMHTHSDRPVVAEPAHEAKLRQGVTVEVIGQDGLGYAPAPRRIRSQINELLREWNGSDGEELGWDTVAGQFATLDEGIAVNVALLAPHGAIRLSVMGMDNRPPTAGELDGMRELVASCLAEGAVGLSTGLQYVPAAYANDDELVALCEVVATVGGYYAPHHRGYGREAMAAYADCLAVARRAGVALHLTHAHLSYKVNEGRAGELLELVNHARSSGMDVTLDSYPYTSGNPYLRMLLPAAVLAEGTATALERLDDLAQREDIRHALEIEGFEGLPVDWTTLEISSVRAVENERWLGQRIADAAATRGQRPVDFYCDLLTSDELATQCIEHIGNEDNVQTIMRDVAHMGGSDGILVGDRPHPRGWGTFPRYLGHYTRDLAVLSWEQVIRKLTSLPAQRLGFSDRGLVRPGMAADITCFDPHEVRELATFDAPRTYPAGIPYVLVNGALAVDDGRATGCLSGRALRRGRRTTGGHA